jgi:hypothetical protein
VDVSTRLSKQIANGKDYIHSTADVYSAFGIGIVLIVDEYKIPFTGI